MCSVSCYTVLHPAEGGEEVRLSPVYCYHSELGINCTVRL
jgi:hypothetical protein